MLLAATLALASAPFWLGPSFAGHPVETHSTPPDLILYGNPAAIQLQDRSTCERNVVALDVVPRRIWRLRGGGIAAEYQRGTVDVATEQTDTTVFAGRDRLARRAAAALRRIGQRRPHRLAAPVFPRAVLRELKRVDVAVHTPRSLEEIGGVLGMGPGVVRARARLAALLPDRVLKNVRMPRRSWAEVQHDRQVAFAAQTGDAEDRFGLTPAQVQRAVRRVRGLTGSC